MIHSIFSTLPTFKKLCALRPGLNVLLAEKTKGASSKQTRNRAGKTSFVEIVNFLMGAKAEKTSIFKTPELIDHTFGIDFDLKNVRTVVERSVGATKSEICVISPPTANAKYSVSDWHSILGESMFGLSSLETAGSSPPTFRSLFTYFARRQSSEAFTTPEKQAVKQKTGDMQTALMFLLGLDWQIARDWQIVRDQGKRLEVLKKMAENGAFGSIVGKAADLRTKLTLQEARLNKLSAQIESFQVLPEYQELEVESAQLTRQLNELANGNTIDFATIRDLEGALKLEVPPELEDLQTIYREAGIGTTGSGDATLRRC